MCRVACEPHTRNYPFSYLRFPVVVTTDDEEYILAEFLSHLASGTAGSQVDQFLDQIPGKSACFTIPFMLFV